QLTQYSEYRDAASRPSDKEHSQTSRPTNVTLFMIVAKVVIVEREMETVRVTRILIRLSEFYGGEVFSNVSHLLGRHSLHYLLHQMRELGSSTMTAFEQLELQ